MNRLRRSPTITRRTWRASPRGRSGRATARWSSTGSIPRFAASSASAPTPLPDGAVQRRRERLVRALQKLPLALPHLWEDVLRFHYVQGLHRGWDSAETETEKEMNP